MTTEVKSLAVYDRISDPMAAVREMGKDIAHSQMFGCSNEEQGRVLAMTCFAKRMDPLALAERYHLIKGKLSMRADAMLAGLHERGGSHRIIQRTADAAEIEIALNGDTQRFTFTWQDAQREPFIYGKEEKGKRPLKDNWATPRSRMQMLWARVVSDGVRAMCPEVVCGKYAPEEIGDVASEEAEEAGDQPAERGVRVEAVDTIDAEFKVVDAPQMKDDGFATADQVTRIMDLYVALQVPFEAQQAALDKRGVRSLRSLTSDQAAEMLLKLQAKADESLGESRADAEAFAASNSDPATQPQIDQVKQAMREIAQNGQQDIAQRVKAKLEESGLHKLSDLSMAEIGGLYMGLQAKNLELFFATTLRGHAKN